VRRGSDLGFLGRDGPCGCAFYGGVGVLEVGERFTEGGDVVQRVQRPASNFRYMNVRVVRKKGGIGRIIPFPHRVPPFLVLSLAFLQILDWRTASKPLNLETPLLELCLELHLRLSGQELSYGLE